MAKLAFCQARKWLFSRSLSSVSTSHPLHVCIVGSGPAGFYTAEKVYIRLSNFFTLFFFFCLEWHPFFFSFTYSLCLLYFLNEIIKIEAVSDCET